MREWARRNRDVRARLDAADEARVAAIRDVFLAHGFEEVEAFTRARIIYFMQIGYYALELGESTETRMKYIGDYLYSFNGV